MSCESLINEYISWLRTHPRGAGQYKVHLTIATNQSQYIENRDCVVGYAFGEVTVPAEVHTPDYLKGDLDQHFSDRVSYGRVDGVDRIIYFNPASVDRVRVTLETSGRVVLQSLTWGGPGQSFNLQCDNRVMFGFGPGVGNGAPLAMYVLSLSKFFTP